MRLALDLEDYHPLVLLHCWLGHLTCKIVSEMTYNVSSGTLNPTVPYHIIIIITSDERILTKGHIAEVEGVSSTISRPCFMTFTGFQSVRESSTSWPWQFLNAYMDWRQSTWLTTAWQSLLSPASDTCGPLFVPRTRTTLRTRTVHCLYQGQGPRSGRGVS